MKISNKPLDSQAKQCMKYNKTVQNEFTTLTTVKQIKQT